MIINSKNMSFIIECNHDLRYLNLRQISDDLRNLEVFTWLDNNDIIENIDYFIEVFEEHSGKYLYTKNIVEIVFNNKESFIAFKLRWS